MQRARAGAAGTAQVKELPPRCARRGLGGLQPIRLVRRATAASPRSLPPASSLQRPPPRTLESLRWLCNCTLTGSAVGRSRACYVLRAACYPCCVRGRTGSACLAGVRWRRLAHSTSSCTCTAPAFTVLLTAAGALCAHLSAPRRF